jgi:hypothetical protein
VLLLCAPAPDAPRTRLGERETVDCRKTVNEHPRRPSKTNQTYSFS